MANTDGDRYAELRAGISGLRPDAVVAIYLFGSHAEHRAHAESDLDLGVVFDFGALPSKKLRFDRSLSLYADLSHFLREDRLDLVVLNDAPPALAGRVAGGGVCVYVGDAEAEHAFRRDAQLKAADIAPFLERTARLKLDALRK
jgi:predicted nucleotidyltransferase